ncbi:MAG: cell division protein ZapA [Dethiobacter sp.]|nr:cell division protein ZapA [Dethiobacter sp.]
MLQGDQKNRISVKIYGEEYTMKGAASPEYMKRLAQYVDEQMRQISKVNRRLGVNKVAVLTAVNMADELFRVRQELHEMEMLLDKKSTL